MNRRQAGNKLRR